MYQNQQDKGFSVAIATVIIIVFNLGGGVGLVAGGTAGQLLYNRRKELMPLLCGLASIATTGPMYYLVNADIKAAGLGPTLGMAALAGVFAAMAAPNVRAAMLNVNGALGAAGARGGVRAGRPGWDSGVIVCGWW